MNPYNFAVLCFSFCAVLISFLVWLKRQDKVGIFFFFFSSLAAGWGVLFSIMLSQNVSYKVALFFSRILNVAAMFIPIVWFHFSLILTSQNKKRLLNALYIMATFISLFMFTPWFIPNLKAIAGFRYYTQAGPAFYFYNVLFLAVLPLGFIQIIKTIRVAPSEQKIQLKGLAIATFIGFMAALPTFLPCYGIDVPQYGLFLMPVYPFVMAYFMTKHNLFDLGRLAEAVHRDKLAAIGTLATSINHEIRNPLFIIKGLADSHMANLEEGIYKNQEEVVRKSSEILGKTSEQAARAMDIMRSFAMFAKQSVQEEPERESVNLNEILDNILPLMRHELELDKVKLIRQIPRDSTLQADRRHLEEILFNLIVNACQAMKSSGGAIEISAEQQNGHFNLLVKDNGPGIPEVQLKKIFEPFYTTKEEGTGLGLYVTKQLVERNSGKISVKSKPGRGTSFVLEFKR